MSSRSVNESKDDALFELVREKASLEQSRLHYLAQIRRIDESLEKNQARYSKIYNEHSPILKLPTEVTCMFFVLSVTTQDMEDRMRVHDRWDTADLPVEIAISHVCKRWRDISLHCPRLWTRFSCSVWNFENMNNQIHRFDTYLNRSGSQNLELFLEFSNSFPDLPPTSKELQATLLEMAINHLERWESVALLAGGLDIEEQFPELILASAPNLKNFVYLPRRPATRLLGGGRVRTIDFSDPPMFKGGAPKLRYLRFDCTNLTVPSLSNITTLRLEAVENDGWANIFFTWESFLAILWIPSLTNLSLAGTIVRVPRLVTSTANTIHMNNLKHLRYSCHPFMTLLLPFLRAPLLETLSIRKDTGRSEDIIGSNPFGIPASESYFFPSLQTLTFIDSAPSSLNAAWRVMQMTKNINQMLISHEDPSKYNPDSTFLWAVREHRPFNDECWPKLTSIIANYGCQDTKQIKVVRDLALSRLPKTLTLHLFPDTKGAWENDCKDIFNTIQENCTIEEVDNPKYLELLLGQPRWPPGLECPLDYAIFWDLFQLEDPNNFEG